MPDGGIETHLIVTKGAQMTLEQETDYTLEELYALADEKGTLQTIVLPGHKEDVITMTMGSTDPGHGERTGICTGGSSL